MKFDHGLELLEADERPAGKPFRDGEVRLASSCLAETRPFDAERKRGEVGEVGGDLFIHPVELLAGEGWLLTCWHEPRTPAEEASPWQEYVETPDELFECVARRWANGAGSNAGDLGTLFLHELILSCVSAGRTLDGWLEDWELAYFLDKSLETTSSIATRTS